MTPLQFNSFRGFLESSSGFQSAQFRELEAHLGRRDSKMDGHLPKDVQSNISEIKKSRSLWDSTLVYLAKRGHAIPDKFLNRDFSIAYQPNSEIQEILIELHRKDPESAMICERLVDFDEGLQEWRYRHVKMVERTIGHKVGTGGSSGVGYLATTLFHPIFPDLWEIRDRFQDLNQTVVFAGIFPDLSGPLTIKISPLGILYAFELKFIMQFQPFGRAK